MKSKAITWHKREVRPETLEFLSQVNFTEINLNTPPMTRPKSFWSKLWALAFLTGCTTTTAYPPYYERCLAAAWEYRFNVERNTSRDVEMEDSGRKACLRFHGPEACLIEMRKLTEEDYIAVCRRDGLIHLK